MKKTQQPPRMLFAAVGLQKGSGGIAELSRQVLKTLFEMQRNNDIRLEVHILEGDGPEDGDDLFNETDNQNICWFAGSRWKFALSLIMTRSDIQLLDHVGLGRLPGLIPAPMRNPYILLIHSIEIWNSNRADYHRTARKAALLIANSNYTAQKARSHYPDLPEIQVCHPGKDVGAGHARDSEAPVGAGHARETESPVRASLAREKDRPHGGLQQNKPVGAGHARDSGRPHGGLLLIGPHAILIVGRLSAEQKHKGHDHLLEAMPEIFQSVPDAQLIIAGEGTDQKRLEAKAQDLGISNQVIFTGWVNEAQLSTLYKQCALFAMPSEGDGFGIVFLEAMANALPCVGLKNTAAAEIFENEKSGIMVDREDNRDMANRLSTLLLDETRRKDLGVAGQKRYQSQFQGQHYAERLQSILMEHSGI
ncbi:glycosyltransferase family 4 protein [Pseudomonadota bacterium]